MFLDHVTSGCLSLASRARGSWWTRPSSCLPLPLQQPRCARAAPTSHHVPPDHPLSAHMAPPDLPSEIPLCPAPRHPCLVFQPEVRTFCSESQQPLFLFLGRSAHFPAPLASLSYSSPSRLCIRIHPTKPITPCSSTQRGF